MINTLEFRTKSGESLTDDEYNQINNSLTREFNVSLSSKDKLTTRLFFLLAQGDEIIALGALLQVSPVFFNDEEFSLLGFVNIIANVKGQGYGKQVLTKMREYLSDHKISGLGFTMPKNRGFYEKCGFLVNQNTQRFVYRKNGEAIINQDGQIIFYQDGSDQFMEKVLASPDKEVVLPTDGLW